MTTQDPELSAALGWPGGIGDPVLDRVQLLQMVAALRLASRQALEALDAIREADMAGATPKMVMKARSMYEPTITALRAALAQEQAEPDLSRCPQCNGPADNGFDRSIPPSPYLCTKCMAEPVEPVAWVASKDGRVIYDDVSKDDSLLRVSGDFENDEQRISYAKQIVDKLNAAPAQQTEPLNLRDPAVQKRLATQWGYVPAAQAEPDHETRAELAEQQVVQLAEERDHFRNLWQKAQQAEPVEQVKTCAWRANLDAIYETECGNLHIVNDGTLEENGMKYCCYCGKEIEDESPT